MLYLKDKPDDNWSQFKDNSMETIVFDDGTEKPFTLSDVTLTLRSKKGVPLSDVADKGLLNWMLKTAVEKADGFTERCVKMRLQELK